MANPQKENGYTAIANELLEKVYQSSFNETQMKIILFVMRYTYGFNRKSHEISLSFIHEKLGGDKRTLQRRLQELIKGNVIQVVSEATFNSSRILTINKDYDNWETCFTPQSVAEPTDGQTPSTTDGQMPYTTDGQTPTHIKQYIKQNLNKTLSSEQPLAAADGDTGNSENNSKTKTKRKYSHDSPYYKSSKWLADKIESRIPGYKKHSESQLQTWADSVRLLFDVDKRDKTLANKLLVFSQEDDFWRNNILSMPTFRSKFDKLLVRYQMLSDKQAQTQSRASPFDTGYIDLADMAREDET